MPTVTDRGASINTTAATTTTASGSFSPAANTVLAVLVFLITDTNTPQTLSVSDTFNDVGVWTEAETIGAVGSVGGPYYERVSIFTAVAGAAQTGSGAITVTRTGGTIGNTLAATYVELGGTIHLAGPVGLAVSSQSGAATTHAVNLGAAPASTSTLLGVFGTDFDTTAPIGTSPTDWTELDDVRNTVTFGIGIGYESAYKLDTGAQTSTWTALDVDTTITLAAVVEILATAAVPSAPTVVRPTARPAAAELTWTLGSDGGSSITDHDVEQSTDNGASWSAAANNATAAAGATVTGLANGTRYLFRVRAVNAIGNGAWATSEWGATPKNVPWLVGAGASVVGTGGTITPTYHSGYTAILNDYCILPVRGRPTDTTVISTPSGYAELETGGQLQEVGANDLRIQAFGKLLTASEALPAVTLPASWQGTSAGASVKAIIIRNVNLATQLDVASVASGAVAAATFTPTGLTPVTVGAFILSLAATADDNVLVLDAATPTGTHQNFTLVAVDATTTGGDHAGGTAYRYGAVAAPTSQATAPDHLTSIWQQATVTDTNTYQYRRNGAGCTIYMIDTGFRGTHNEFTGRVGSGFVPTGSGWTATQDNQGHGTGTAATAAGTTYGPAKGATLVPVKIIDSAGFPLPDIDDYEEALEWILANHPANSIVTTSLDGYATGTADGDRLAAAITNLIDDGVIFCTAVGNAGVVLDDATFQPGVISVGGSDELTRAWDVNSNHGWYITLAAPYSVTTAANTNDTATKSDAGTSYSSPIVAGVCAAIWQSDLTMSARQVEDILIAQSTKDILTGVPAGTVNRMVWSLAESAGAAGAVVMPTWRQSTLGNDVWAAISVALRPAAAATPAPPMLRRRRPQLLMR